MTTCEFCEKKGKRRRATYDVLILPLYGGGMAYVCDTHYALRDHRVKGTKL